MRVLKRRRYFYFTHVRRQSSRKRILALGMLVTVSLWEMSFCIMQLNSQTNLRLCQVLWILDLKAAVVFLFTQMRALKRRWYPYFTHVRRQSSRKMILAHIMLMAVSLWEMTSSIRQLKSQTNQKLYPRQINLKKNPEIISDICHLTSSSLEEAFQ